MVIDDSEFEAMHQKVTCLLLTQPITHYHSCLYQYHIRDRDDVSNERFCR